MRNAITSTLRSNGTAEHDNLAFWRDLGQHSVLRCPDCAGVLAIGTHAFVCSSCSSQHPVDDGVPLVFPKEEIRSVPDRVMEVFNIPAERRGRVEGALAALTRYKTVSHPEFANFFARFDPSEGRPRPVLLTAGETADTVARVRCLTMTFPDTLRSDVAEYRSLRIRNESDRVLYTDDRYPLHIGYKLQTPDGEPVLFEGERSPIPSPIVPGNEMTIAVKLALPAGFSGDVVARLFFVLDAANEPTGVEPPPASTPVPAPVQKGRLGTLREATARWLRTEPCEPDMAAEPEAPAGSVWFEDAILAEVNATAISQKTEFPAEWRGEQKDFRIETDVSLADEYLADVVSDLKRRGVKKPRILEVGAGVHPVSLRLADADVSVVVSDISLVMQRIATIMHTDNPAMTDGRAGFMAFDMMHPPFANESFDVICICAALHHIPQPVVFLQKVARLLSPEGRFVALREPCNVNPHEPTYIAEVANGFNEQMFELPEWINMIDRGGLAIDNAVIDYDCSLKFSARRAST